MPKKIVSEKKLTASQLARFTRRENRQEGLLARRKLNSEINAIEKHEADNRRNAAASRRQLQAAA